MTSIALGILLLLGAPQGGLEPGPSDRPGVERRWSQDGVRTFEARPLGPGDLCPGAEGPEACRPRQGAWPQRLRYPSLGGLELTAWLGAPALVAVAPGQVPSAAQLAAARLRWLGWADAGSGWGVVEADPPGEDGIDLAARLLDLAWVAHALPDLLLPHRPAWAPDDPLFPVQWHLEEVQAAAAWDLGQGAAELRVGIIDGGYQMDHPDLATRVVDGWDALDRDDDPSPEPAETSGNHGTAVACVAAAATDNGEGVAGACPRCSVVPIRLVWGGLTAVSSDVAAFAHAIDHDVAVVNNSWGYGEATPAPLPLLAVLGRAESEGRGGRGMLVVFAAGNEDREILRSELHAQPEVVSVGATDRYGSLEGYSNFGETLSVVAPTGAVTCDLEGGYTRHFSGTSSAAPLVTGLLALALQRRPELSAARVRELLVATAFRSPLLSFDEAGHNPRYGYGRIDPVALLQAVAAEGSGGEDLGPARADLGPTAEDLGPPTADLGSGLPDGGPWEGDDLGSGERDLAADASVSGPEGAAEGDGDTGCSCAQRSGRALAVSEIAGWLLGARH